MFLLDYFLKQKRKTEVIFFLLINNFGVLFTMQTVKKMYTAFSLFICENNKNGKYKGKILVHLRKLENL